MRRQYVQLSHSLCGGNDKKEAVLNEASNSGQWKWRLSNKLQVQRGKTYEDYIFLIDREMPHIPLKSLLVLKCESALYQKGTKEMFNNYIIQWI